MLGECWLWDVGKEEGPKALQGGERDPQGGL